MVHAERIASPRKRAKAANAAAYPARPPTEQHREAEMVPAIFSGETFFGTSDAEAPSSNEGAQYGQ
jgi:hypothetical protein